MHWPSPSSEVAELIRQLAQIVLEAEDAWLDTLDRAALASDVVKAIADDPVLRAGSRRNTRLSIQHWAACNVSHPGEPVPVNVSPETMTLARDLARRGLDASALNTFRSAQDAAMLLLVDLVYELAPEPVQARELLRVCMHSMSDYIGATTEVLTTQLESERADLTRGSQAERREVVALILDGAPIATKRAEHRLGYQLARHHTAFVIWSDEPAPDMRHLEEAAELLASGRRPLTVQASAATLWAWIPGAEAPAPALAEELVGRHPHLRISAGSTGPGMPGFRRSHLEALTAQRILAAHQTRRTATFAETHLVSLCLEDPDAAAHFVSTTLGDLESARPEAREALRSYLREQCNAARAARGLYMHRNTFLRRLDQAEELLPGPLAENAVDVGAALEMQYWTGHRRVEGSGR